MNKVLVAGLVVAVGAAGYVGGVAWTADKVNSTFMAQMDQLSDTYAGQADISFSGSGGSFSSDYQVTIEMLGVPEDLVADIGTNALVLDVNFQHGFLNSVSTSKLADTQLRTDLKEIQADANEEFLTSETRYSYDMGSKQVQVDGDFRLAALSYSEDGESMTLAASEGAYNVLGNNFKVSLNLGDFVLDAVDGDLEVTGVQLSESGVLYEQDPMMTTAFDLLLAAKKFRFKDGEQMLNIEDFKITADQRTEGDRTFIGVGYGAKEILVQGPDVAEPVSFAPNLHLILDVDFNSIYELSKQMIELQKTNPQQLEDPFMMMGMVGAVTGKGMGLEIDDLSIGLKGSKVTATADLVMDPFTMEEAMMDQQGMLQKVALDANLVIPNEMLEAISALDPEFDPSMLEIAVLQGMLVQDENGFRGELSVKDGQVVLNGTPLPL